MSKHGQEYNERTPALGVEEVVKKIEYEIQINHGWKEDDTGFAGFTKDGKELIASILTKEKEALVREILAAGKVHGGTRDHIWNDDILAIAARHGINIQ